jgi:DNA-binding NtrC family response regulator
MAGAGDVLIVDDEASARELFGAWLRGLGHTVRTAADGADGLAQAQARPPDVVVLDLQMTPDTWDGLRVLTRLGELFPGLPVVIASDKADLRRALEAISLGAHDFVDKQEARERLGIVVANALRYVRLRDRTVVLEHENRFYREERQRERRAGLHGITGSSEVMQRVYDLILRVAPTDASVLIMGETGTGKELVASALHYHSGKRDGPFVKVNCAALAETLLEDELFGHEKGAYTGADAKRPGRFELAHGGTLFLDEVGDMSLATQAKVLRVLQEREFERVGGTRTIRVDVRVVAATNHDLAASMREGRFRTDLYYRLNDVVLELPPLRERREDIPLLATKVLDEMGDAYRGRSLSADALAALVAYSWPGNIRELRATLRTACILAASEAIELGDLPLAIRGAPEPSTGSAAVSCVESALIRSALATLGGDLGEAARRLGVKAADLVAAARKHGFK